MRGDISYSFVLVCFAKISVRAGSRIDEPLSLYVEAHEALEVNV